MAEALTRCGSCGSDEIERDDVDIGGPWGCPNCGWSSDPYWDCSHGAPPAAKDHPGFSCTPTGGLFRKVKDELVVKQAPPNIPLEPSDDR